MLEFKSITIRNFLSVGNKPLTFKYEKGLWQISGKNLDTGERNGVGKSTIMADALVFCLKKKTIKKLTLGQIHNSINQKELEVSCDLTVNGKDYTIERGLKPNYLKLNGKEYSTMDATQEKIDDIINMNYKTLINVLILSINHSIPYMEMTASDKRGLIDDVLGVSVIGEMSTEVIKEHNILKNEEEKAKLKLEGKQLTLNQMDETIKKIEEKKKEFEENKTIKLKELNKTKDELKESLENADKNIKDVEVLIDMTNLNDTLRDEKNTLSDMKNQLDINNNFKKKVKADAIELYPELEKLKSIKEITIKLTEINEKLDNDQIKIKHLNEEKSELSHKKNTTSMEIKNIEKEIASLGKQASTLENSTVCPTCKREVEDKQSLMEKATELKEQSDQKKKENITKNKDIENIEKEEKELLEKLNKLPTANPKIQDVLNYIHYNKENCKSVEKDKYVEITKSIQIKEKDIKETEEKNEEITKKNEEITKSLDVIKDIKRDLESIIKDIEKEEETTLEIDNLIDDESYTNLENDVGDAKSELTKTTHRKEHFEVLREIMSDKGVKSYIIKKIINFLNNRINYYLDKLNAPFHIEFDEKLNETFKSIGRNGFVYANFSGGQAKRIDFALSLAFMDISMAQGQSANLLILDEALDTSMDSYGVAKLLDLLKQRVVDNNMSINVITHKSDVNGADIFDGVKDINMKSGFTFLGD